MLVLACVLRPAPTQRTRRPPSPNARLLDWALPAGLAAVTAGLVLGVQKMGVEPGPLSIALMFAAPLLICYLFLFRPLRFGLGVAALLLAGGLYHGEYGGTELRMRSFFAVHRVTVDPTGHFRQLVHGDTVHGRQSLRPGEEHEPLTYYHRSGPIGQVFAALDYNDPEKRDPRLNRVGVVGLGAGSLCCYARNGEDWTFYEIDPAVRYIACDSKLFTFYSGLPGREVRGAGRRPAVVAAVEQALRRAGHRRLRLGRDPGPFADARGDEGVPGSPRPRRHPGLQHFQPLSGSANGAGRPGDATRGRWRAMRRRTATPRRTPASRRRNGSCWRGIGPRWKRCWATAGTGSGRCRETERRRGATTSPTCSGR